MTERPIAVLDSGVGGLTVVKQMLAQIPGVSLVYVGDTARTPYGPRDPEDVRSFTEQIVSFLLSYQPQMIVIACNTATAVALARMQQVSPVPVLGVIDPGARAAVKATRSGRIGVIGTEGTIRSRAYETAIRSLDVRLTVCSLACPAFVPLVERGAYESAEAEELVHDVLAPMRTEQVDTLILGCTHYPFLAPVIQRSMGSRVRLISSATEVAQDVRKQRTKDPITAVGDVTLLCTGDPQAFEQIARRWLGWAVDARHCVLPALELKKGE